MAPTEDVILVITLALVTFLAPFCSSLIVGKLVQIDGKWITLVNCFAAGIFISITFFHILAESVENTKSLFPEDATTESVLNYVCVFFLFGFLCMLWLDKLWFSRFHHHTHEEGSDVFVQHIVLEPVENASSNGNSEVPVAGLVKKKKKMIALGTLVAFSFHSFLEGVAIGAEHPSREFIYFVLLFSLHKVMDGLAVIIPLSRVDFSSTSYWALVLLFSTMTPLGITLSFLIFQDGGLLTKYAGPMEAVSGGVFLYIAQFHILAEELEHQKNMFWKVLTFSLSLSIMYFFEYTE